MLARFRSCLAAAFLLTGPVAAQTPADALTVLMLEPPGPVLSYTVLGRETAIFPRDIAAVEISESGGITDVFLRFGGAATKTLSLMTAAAIDTPMVVQVCGAVMLEATVQDTIRSGTLYLPNTTAVRAEALRALWHGRARCDTFAPEVFTDGN